MSYVDEVIELVVKKNPDEPEFHQAVKEVLESLRAVVEAHEEEYRRDALLENVTVDKEGKIDFNDKTVTENTRVSYPIDHIDNIVRPVSSAPAAKNVIFLSADAFGLLPLRLHS